MLSSRTLALRRQLPSLVRHQSTKIPRWHQFSEDIRDAERRGTLRAPPSDHPFPPLWRCKELSLFYQRGIVTTWKQYQAAPSIDSREHFRASRASVQAIRELAKLIFCPLLPFAAFVPNIIFPESCILPAQLDRYVHEALRMPPSADIIAAHDMLRKIGGLDFRRLAMGEPDQQEFWVQHHYTILSLWRVYPMPPVSFRAYMLQGYLNYLVEEDDLLRERDLAFLNYWEVVSAVGERGMFSHHTSEKEERALLHWWLHESGNDSGTPENMVDKALAVHVHILSKSSQSV
ncbi:hypothetical protein BDZ89DRAFT_1064438 [Hymenopellis radicata]|nr:hypothetical protein BDZ89DRAFT_1064438 [Hymenopellis radicata]